MDGVTGDCVAIVAVGGGVQGLDGGGSASNSLRGGSTTPSLGDPGAEARPRERSEGERLNQPIRSMMN